MSHTIEQLPARYAGAWVEFAKAALTGVLASQPWYISHSGENVPVAHWAAYVADEMMQEYFIRFPGAE